jgi:[NiFe] hydrogenase diaphorase moiety small subunit
MSTLVKFKIDGVECMAESGIYLVEAARENGIYIPTLCNIKGVKPRGSCRICTVMVNGRPMSACTTPVADGMEILNDTPEINDIRKAIVEVLFVEGNHFCPACEKSGNCELQALAYKFKMMVPRFPYLFPNKDVDASSPKIIKDHNRCILCKRCIRAIVTEDGKNVFAFKKRGLKLEIIADPEMGEEFTDELAQKAIDICPVGAILPREQGYKIPIGQRKYDHVEIGSDIEKK